MVSSTQFGRFIIDPKNGFFTSLQLIRESFISWLCEEIIHINPLELLKFYNDFFKFQSSL